MISSTEQVSCSAPNNRRKTTAVTARPSFELLYITHCCSECSGYIWTTLRCAQYSTEQNNVRTGVEASPFFLSPVVIRFSATAICARLRLNDSYSLISPGKDRRRLAHLWALIMRGYLTVREKVSYFFLSLFSCFIRRSRRFIGAVRFVADMRAYENSSALFVLLFFVVKIRESYQMGKKMFLLFPSNYLRSIFSGRPVP